MRSKLIMIVSVAATLVVVLAEGCVSPQCRGDWLATVEEAQQSTYGGWLQMLYQVDETKVVVYGELIAVHQDSIFWLEDNNLRSLAREDVARVQLFTYRSQHSMLTAWTWLGTLSTASHGVILIFSAPAWIVFGSLTTSAVSREPVIGYVSRGGQKSSSSDWLRLSHYARFPQGIPQGLDRRLIRAKPPNAPQDLSN